MSTEEQAQVIDGSIDNQQHRLKSFIDFKNTQEKKWGVVVDTYVDDGFSAKDTKRPAYQRMMRDIQNGKINQILVTDISRLSRNIADFCDLVKDLEKCRAKFFSVKEQFDTSTPAGEMMLYNMINLAQFERKQTSERVSMNFHSRALRGLVNGGISLLGFDKDPTNSGKLIVVQEEVQNAKIIFEQYLKTGSLQGVANFLNDNGIKPKKPRSKQDRHIIDGRWTVSTVRSVLTNLAYIGKREINRGNKDEDQNYLKPWQRYQVVDAAWKGFIEEVDFYRVQVLIEENRQKERERRKDTKARFFLLSGIIRCGDCGRALIGETAHGKIQTHRYYSHKKVVGETIPCKHMRFRANDIEDAVVQHLDEILLRAGHLDKVEVNMRKIMSTQSENNIGERERVQKELKEIENDIDATFSLFTLMGQTAGSAILVKEKLEVLAEKKKKLTIYQTAVLDKIERNNDIKEARTIIEDNARAFKRGWRKANPATQKRLLRRLIDGLVYAGDGLHTFYVTAKASAASVLEQKTNQASESISEACSHIKNILKNFTDYPAGLYSANGSPIVCSGGD